MTKREKLEAMLEEVKQKISMLGAIEERLLVMRDLVLYSRDIVLLSTEKHRVQNEINQIFREIELLKMEPTLKS